MHWKTGFEIELLAPAGQSRRDLAQALAGDQGRVKRCFYPQSEPSAVPGTPVFENLILGFDAVDATGEPIAKLVDDLTIRQDLNHMAPPTPGWYRILSDDRRLLRLVMIHCDPTAQLGDVLNPLGDLFGTVPTVEEDDLIRLSDAYSAPIAIVTGVPGERERPCEIITPPIEADHHDALEKLLSVARDMDFTVPVEAAVHIHFDGTRLRDAKIFARLADVTRLHGKALRRLMGTNPHNIRLGSNPKWFFKTTASADFQNRPWEEAKEDLQDRDLTKYVDFNFLNLVHDIPGKPTFEVRILPGAIHAEPIVKRAEFFEALLNWCIDAPQTERAEKKINRFVNQIGAAELSLWLTQ